MPEIVIDRNGVRLESETEGNSEQEAVRKEYEKKAAATIAGLTGTAEEHINVKWSEKT